MIIIIEGLSLLQSIPPTTANKQTQAQKKRVSMARKLGFRVLYTNNIHGICTYIRESRVSYTSMAQWVRTLFFSYIFQLQLQLSPYIYIIQHRTVHLCIYC